MDLVNSTPLDGINMVALLCIQNRNAVKIRDKDREFEVGRKCNPESNENGRLTIILEITALMRITLLSN